jgi:hypothetical protein
MKQQLARLQQRRQETVVVKDRQQPLAISLRVVYTNEQRPRDRSQDGERWPIPSGTLPTYPPYLGALR